MNLVVLGPQGSGKGTQAEKLAQKFGLEHIDMGFFLRLAAKKDTPLGREINEIINVKKELVNDRILKKVLHLKLQDLPREQGVIFDGVPRRMDQLEYFEEAMLEFGRVIDKVIFINISEKESVKRISKRWICKKCRKILIMGKDVKSEKDLCPKCQEKIIQRADDSQEGVKKRLAIFEKETMKVIECFRGEGMLIEINGEQTQKEVFGDILKSLQITN